ncbi:MAG: TrkA family potassium uptake protein [Dehalococcoidia bacterium]|nr:TrkA family potassium uptake protein [Dehalococcoidia bacterium]
MKIVIMGCGRVGAMVARAMALEGHAVAILDTSEDNLRRLPDHLGVTTLLGDGTLEQDLRRAGIEEADVFVAVEERDSRNALAAQKALHLFNVRKVICNIGDPVRQEMYRALGLETVSPAKAASDMILQALHR